MNVIMNTRRIFIYSALALIVAASYSIALRTSSAQSGGSCTLTVTNTNDSGPGSLRQAIIDANVNSDADTICFNIPANDPGHFYYRDDAVAGQVTLANVMTTTAADDSTIADIDPDWPHSWWSIQATSEMVVGEQRNTTIDGYTQSGASPNTLADGINAILRIELNGTAVGGGIFAHGLRFQLSTGGGVRGLVINRYGSNGIDFSASSGSSAQGNFLGTDVSGTLDLGNAQVGIRVGGGGNFTASSNTVGGTTPEARNLISGNNLSGVQLTGNFNIGNVVQGNFIGTDRSGNRALGNGTVIGHAAVRMDTSRVSRIGGASPAARNVISGNVGAGIGLAGAVTDEIRDNLVQGNFIGVGADGTTPLGNSGEGVLLSNFFANGSTRNNTIGGTAPGEGNLIAYNGGDGVSVNGFSTGFGNAILGNSIFSNGTTPQHLGIDLSDDAVTPNDACDPDVGANNQQNFPTINSASRNGNNLTIEGTLNSTANTTFRVEFFANQDCDSSGAGEGKTFVGSASITTGSDCVADFTGPNAITFTIPPDFPAAQRITATATDPAGNTSEFSLCSTPSAIKLVDFTAAAHGDAILLEWQTGFEVDNLGFNIYREDAGRKVQLNRSIVAGSALLAGAGTPLTAGKSYSWKDALPQTDRNAQYWLEEISLDGQSNWHGPVGVQDSGEPALAGRRTQDSGLGSQRSALLAELGGGDPARDRSVSVEVKAALPLIKSAEMVELQSSLAAGPAIKISVSREGWYQITQQELIQAGLDPSADPRLLQLYVDGQSVPISVIGESDGRLDPTDAVEFYAVGLDTPSTDARTYWLVVDTEPGQRVRQLQSGRTAPASDSFPFTVERRDRSVYFVALRNGEQENFFGAVIARDPVEQTIHLRDINRSSPQEAVLEIALQGVSFTPHSVSTQLNGSHLGELSFNGHSHQVARFALPASLIKEGTNQLTLTARGGAADVSLIDYIRLTYQRSYRAENNALWFEAEGDQQLSIGGFTSGDIRVIDITDPDAAREVMGTISQKGHGYAITVTTPPGGRSRLLAFAKDRTRSPAAVTANQPSRWAAAGQGADLVIITRRELFASLALLKSLRQGQGLAVALADVEDLYDEFSFGHKSPQSIKDFLLRAKTSWKRPPRFVLFAGDASFDARDYLGFGAGDLVPTRMVDTQFMETASDDWFADFDGDGVPELSVGRLPARTEAQAATMVEKIIAYEQSDPSQELLLVSDANEGFDFQAASARLRELVGGGLRVEEIRRGEADDAATKGLLIEAINRGQKIVNYTGHGSVDVWRANLLSSTDAASLSNGERLSIFVMMTCLNGYFQDARIDSLAESLIKAEGGGAVAVWASTGMTLPHEQAIMNQEFYRLVFQADRTPTLGEAARQAKLAIGDSDIRRTWVLLGDPAMRIR